MSNTISIFKLDMKMRKYVEVYAIPPENKEMVNTLLSKVTIDTPEEEIQDLFKGLCKVLTRSDFKKSRRKYIRGQLALLAVCLLLVAINIYIIYS